VSVKTGVDDTSVEPATDELVEIWYVPAWLEVVDPDVSTLIVGKIKVSMKSCSVMA
jgi:hypothetical protein